MALYNVNGSKVFFFSVNGQRYQSDKPFKCPCCGTMVAVNCFKILGQPRLKFTELAEMPSEGSWSDVHDDATCEDCAG